MAPYLDRDTLVTMNQTTDGGGVIMNEGALHTAIRRPQQAVFGHQLSWAEKVQIVILNLARHHPFRNGNKRTTVAAIRRYYEINHTNAPAEATIWTWVNRITANDYDPEVDDEWVKLQINGQQRPDGEAAYEPDADEDAED